MDNTAVPEGDSEPSLRPGRGDDFELRKPLEMLVMVPRSGRVTLTGRKIYSVLLRLTQEAMSDMKAVPPADFLFEAPLHEILRSRGSDGEDRTLAKRYLREMRGLEVDWESGSQGDGTKWRALSMLSEVSIELRKGELWVGWAFPPTIIGALWDPKRWARIDLRVVAKLSSVPAIQLYEIAARYKDNPSGLTGRKPPGWWVMALSQSPEGAEKREWRKFKSERVKQAIEEINAETDLEVGLIEHKKGRAVVEVQFSVRKKFKPAAKQSTGPADAGLIALGERLGIREMRLEGLIREFGEEAVRDKIQILERRKSNNRLSPVEDSYAFLRGCLRNGLGDVAQRAPDAPKSEVSAEGEIPAAQGTAEPDSAAAKAAEFKEMAEKHERLKREFRTLSQEQRDAIVAQAVEELASKGLMDAIMARRVQQGDVLYGVLGRCVTRVFGNVRLGLNWDSDGGSPGASVTGDSTSPSGELGP